MSQTSKPLTPSTPAGTAAGAQTREGASLEPIDGGSVPPDGSSHFDLGTGVRLATRTKPHERQPDEPLYRPLRIFALDPTATSKLEGASALINVPYEPLTAGPRGSVFEVVDRDGARNVEYTPVDLDEKRALIEGGRAPSLSDPMFHQQMAYAVCSTVYTAFRQALGRHVAWGFGEAEAEGVSRLRIRPHAFEVPNAFYDKTTGTLDFGYYRASEVVAGSTLPGSIVYTCLSHDIVAHETTHALLDGLRSHFTRPTRVDVLAFHEAFADLVAIFQHFSFEKIVLAAIRKSRGDLGRACLLTDLAIQFGQTTNRSPDRRAVAMRTAIDVSADEGEPQSYSQDLEIHELGSVLVSAVFEAFVTVFKRKTAQLVRLASNGTGVLAAGELPQDLQELLARAASSLASQFLSIIVRAIDYCPPVDLEFGDFLRALVTADVDLVPDDPWAYREALIDAFARRRIYPRYVRALSEDALVWRSPEHAIANVEPLSFKELRFSGDPSATPEAEELERQARALGELATRPENLRVFGLTPATQRVEPGADVFSRPRVESIRMARRVGPDGQIVYDLVGEIVQRRSVRAGGSHSFDIFGGSTVILGPRGEVRYVIRKSVTKQERVEEQRRFVTTGAGAQFWSETGGAFRPRRQTFALVHASRPESAL